MGCAAHAGRPLKVWDLNSGVELATFTCDGATSSRAFIRGVSMVRSAQPVIPCAGCNKPIDLAITKTNERGKAVHEECYVLRQALKDATQPNTRPPASYRSQVC